MELLLGVLKWSMIAGTAALALTLLKPLLDKRYSAKWRYGAWLVMAALLLLSPVRWEKLIPQAPVTPAVVIEVPKVEVSVSSQDGVSFQRPAGAVRPSVNSGALTAPKAAVKAKTFPMEELLTTLWLTGAALFLLYHGLGTWYFTRRARRWSKCAGEDTLRIYDAVCRDMGLKHPPALRVSAAVDSPMMMGVFRSRLLLPTEDFGELELAFILRHELTHHRRHDLWYKLALTLANAVHWFNPLIYLLRREAERDLELTCDDAVVAGTGVEVRRAYSETLLASIHRQRGLSRAVLSTHFYGGKEVMKERFRNILGKRGRKRGVLVLAVVLLATVAAACAFGLQTSTDGALSVEEIVEWQERLESPEMDHYIYRMYSDVSYLPSEETMEEMFRRPESVDVLGHADIDPKVLSGTKSGDTVTLEIEGNFAPRLSSGTLTLVNGEPVSFTNPLYTAVETSALDFMDSMAGVYIAESSEYGNGGLEFTEKYIASLFCSETMEFDDKTYYLWELFYLMKPNDLDNVFFAGGMSEINGWLTQSGSVGDPIFIASVDADGNIAVEELTYTSTTGETGYTWEEYIYCHLNLGMNIQAGILNGWPDLNTPFLESLRDGHDTWALDWQDTALSYLSTVYDIYSDGGFEHLRTFQANERENDHDQAILVQRECGDRTVTLLLAHVCYPVEVWNTIIQFWQVVGEKWEPDAPEVKPDEPAEPDVTQPVELSADEMASLTSYFNVVQHNGLLRVPYNEFRETIPYMGVMLYDMGTNTPTEERQAVVDAFFDGDDPGVDCSKLSRDTVMNFFSTNFPVNMTEADFSYYWDQLKEQMLYLEEYDAFYLVRGDTMMNSYTFDRAVWNNDGTVSAYYTTDLWQYNSDGELDILWDQPMCATLVPFTPDSFQGWLVASNQIVE